MTVEELDLVIYRPLPHRSPEALRHDSFLAVVQKDSPDGRGMLIFRDLFMLAAVPEEMIK